MIESNFVVYIVVLFVDIVSMKKMFSQTIICAHFEWLPLVLGLVLLLSSTTLLQADHRLVLADPLPKANLKENNDEALPHISGDQFGKSGPGLSLISWQTFLRTYNKHYSSISQNLMRQKIFMARMMETFLSLARFIRKQSSYYLAINKYSDWTNRESKQLLVGEIGAGGQRITHDNGPMADNEAERLLVADMIHSDGLLMDASPIEEPVKLRRKKRSIFERFVGQQWPSFDSIRAPGNNSDKAGDHSLNSMDNLKWMIPSTNPNYEPIVELIKKNRFEEDIDNDDYEYDDTNAEDYRQTQAGWDFGLMNSLKNVLDGAYNWLVPKEGGRIDIVGSGWFQAFLRPFKGDQIDESTMSRDWRKSGCIREPMEQGHCKSCYAISTMSFVEWALCMHQNGILTPLSVQYMIDCGRQFSAESEHKYVFSGCDGGLIKHSIQFIYSYGIELEANMPYVDREFNCPIPYGTSANKKGYIRPYIQAPIRLGNQTEKLDLALKKGPVVVSFLAPRDFLAYGGGMIDSCYSSHDTGHAMLIVGSGSENGHDYLLIKNSFGTKWGLNGYFKFKRSAAEGCVKEYISHRVTFSQVREQLSAKQNNQIH